MYDQKFYGASWFALALTSMSCATIIQSSEQTIDFSSQPAGATITIDGKAYDQTQMAIPLKRNGRLAEEPKGKEITQYAYTK